jgi:HEAT repeat protein
MNLPVSRCLLLISFLLEGLTLAAQGPKADPRAVKEQVRAALMKLAEDSKDEREAAALSLWELGPAAKDGSPALVRALKDASPRIRLYCAGALLRIDQANSAKALPVVVSTLKAPDSTSLEALVVCKALRPSGPELIAGLLEMLHEDHPLVAAAGRMALENVGPSAAPAAAVLKTALKDRSTDVRLAAATALLRIDAAWKKEVEPVLQRLLRASDYSVRVEVGKLLRQINPALGPKIAIALATALESKDLADRLVVAELLVEVAPEEASAITTALAEGLKDRAAEKRRSCAAKLGALGRYARGAEKELREVLGDPEAAVAVDAVEALFQVLPDKAIDLLPLLASQRDRRDKTKIAEVLELLLQLDKLHGEAMAASPRKGGELEKERIRALTEELGKPRRVESSDVFQLHAASRLAQLGPKAKDAVPTLSKVLEDAKGPLKFQVIFALGKVGPDARSAVPSLLKIYRDRDSVPIGLRREAAVALLGIDPKTARAEGVR